MEDFTSNDASASPSVVFYASEESPARGEITGTETSPAKLALFESLSNGTCQTDDRPFDWSHVSASDSVERLLETTLRALSDQWALSDKETSLNHLAKILADATTRGECLIDAWFGLLKEYPVVPYWRTAFGEHGILEFFLERLDEYQFDSAEWIVHALRLVANCCAGDDTSNANRERVQKRPPFARLIQRLKSPKNARIAVVALYSICADFGMVSSMEHNPTNLLQSLHKRRHNVVTVYRQHSSTI